MKKYLWQAFILVSICFLFVACNKKEEEVIDEEVIVLDDIHEHFQKTVEIEKEIETIQQKKSDLEKQDEEIYQEITSLNFMEQEKIVELADEAIALLDDRFEFVRQERETMTKSQTEFTNIQALMEELTDEKKISQLDIVYRLMMDRYKAYDNVYEHYTYSLFLAEELYRLLKNDQQDESELFSLIEEINETYENVFAANEEFNTITNAYNKEKETFYDLLNEGRE